MRLATITYHDDGTVRVTTLKFGTAVGYVEELRAVQLMSHERLVLVAEFTGVDVTEYGRVDLEAMALDYIAGLRERGEFLAIGSITGEGEKS